MLSNALQFCLKDERHISFLEYCCEDNPYFEDRGSQYIQPDQSPREKLWQSTARDNKQLVSKSLMSNQQQFEDEFSFAQKTKKAGRLLPYEMKWGETVLKNQFHYTLEKPALNKQLIHNRWNYKIKNIKKDDFKLSLNQDERMQQMQMDQEMKNSPFLFGKRNNEFEQ